MANDDLTHDDHADLMTAADAALTEAVALTMSPVALRFVWVSAHAALQTSGGVVPNLFGATPADMQRRIDAANKLLATLNASYSRANL